jgi:autotransporter translocation and assembly factor TamB
VDQDVQVTLGVRAPFVSADARVATTTTPLATDAPIDLTLDVKQLELGRLFRGLDKPPTMDGHLKVAAHVDGTAAAPHLDLTAEASALSVQNPARQDTGVPSVSVGHGRLHVTYADRAARAKLDFQSAHGGMLTVDAAAHINLGYPRGVRRLVVSRVPVTGKVTAKRLDVGWIAAFNPRVESLGGQVTADARLAGTMADLQVIGDVRWKNGELVANAPSPTEPTKPLPPSSPSRPTSAR